MLQSALLNWWANDAIRLAPGVCPTSQAGEAQTASVVVDAASWTPLYFWAFVVTVGIALAAVFLTYYTRTMGAGFARRWWVALLITMVVAAGASLLVVLGPEVQTFGCQYGEVRTHIPLAAALSRAGVSLLQAPLLFFLGSLLLTRAVRYGRWQPFYNNSRYPV